ncbi:MAG: methyltransferase domain-containing protein [Dehalococcoidales bacterium]|nr:methyltransferase domain-containing protein [Dehalococcoidales bacterium]
MTTSFSKDLTGTAVKNKIRRFYDLGSPLYLEVYGNHIHDGYYLTGNETKQAAQENLTKLLAEKAGIKRGDRVLDVGCGIGGSSLWLAENRGASTVGISISPVQIEIAGKLAQDRHVDSEFLLMDAEKMRFEEKFDAIWVLAAITHFPHQKSFVKKATASLKQGGKFVIFDWMLHEHVLDPLSDRYVKPVSETMLLSSLYSLNTYLEWFMSGGYRIIYAEDVTVHTAKTWDDALSVIKEPAVLKMAAHIKKEDIGEILRFLKSISAMKAAMQNHRLIGGIVIAEKL